MKLLTFIALLLATTLTASAASAGKAETPNLYKRMKIDAPACRTSAQFEKLEHFVFAKDDQMYLQYLMQSLMDGTCHKIPKGTEVFIEEAHPFGSPCVRIIGKEVDCSFTSNSFLEVSP